MDRNTEVNLLNWIIKNKIRNFKFFDFLDFSYDLNLNYYTDYYNKIENKRINKYKFLFFINIFEENN
jgi:hypothetical protein